MSAVPSVIRVAMLLRDLEFGGARHQALEMEYSLPLIPDPIEDAKWPEFSMECTVPTTATRFEP